MCHKQFCLFWLPRAVDLKVSCSQTPRRAFAGIRTHDPLAESPTSKPFGHDTPQIDFEGSLQTNTSPFISHVLQAWWRQWFDMWKERLFHCKFITWHNKISCTAYTYSQLPVSTAWHWSAPCVGNPLSIPDNLFLDYPVLQYNHINISPNPLRQSGVHHASLDARLKQICILRLER
jgi:hypothetical protein